MAFTSHNLSPELKEGQEFYSVLLLVLSDGYTSMKVPWNLKKILGILSERCILQKKTQVKMVEDTDTFPYHNNNYHWGKKYIRPGSQQQSMLQQA